MITKEMALKRHMSVTSSDNYVKDGLYLHLDGIYNTRQGFNSNSNVWEDLSGNDRDFALTRDISLWQQNNTGWVNKSLQGDNHGGSGRRLKDFPFNEFTVEMVGRGGFVDDLGGYASEVYLFNNRATGEDLFQIAPVLGKDKRAACTVYNKDKFYNGFPTFLELKSLCRIVLTYKDEVMTVSVNDFETRRENFVLFNTSADEFSTHYLAGNQSKFYSSATMHAVRVYDRALSVDELVKNKELDLKRFELEL